MHQANPFWGAPRIHGELQKLGIEIAETTVAKYLGRRPSSPSPTWRTFLRTHLSQSASMDFFTVPTATFRVLFVLVILSHDRRHVVPGSAEYWVIRVRHRDCYLRPTDLGKKGTLDLLFLGFLGNFTNQGLVASGNGNGTFALFSSFPIGASQAGLNMVVGDFNGDGFPDVAVYEEDDTTGCFPTRNIEIFLQGAGGTKTFALRSSLPVSPIGVCVVSQFSGMVAADFDKDGKVDLVAQVATNGNRPANALFFKGKGDGTFEAPTVVGTGLPEIVDYVAADVNNDGNLDLIGIGGDSVWVQLGNGDGTFQPPVPYAFGGSCIDSVSCVVKVADFDGDGNPDIAVSSRDLFAGFAVLRGKGDGTFEPPVKFAVGATGTDSLEIADVNGDGLPDVVIRHGGENGNNYTVLFNNSLPMAPQSR